LPRTILLSRTVDCRALRHQAHAIVTPLCWYLDRPSCQWVSRRFPRYFKTVWRVDAARKHVFALQHFDDTDN
jgi:hypothetical protein